MTDRLPTLLPGIFRLPDYKRRKSTVNPRLSPAAVEATSSDARVLANTPCLLALYEFLARPIP